MVSVRKCTVNLKRGHIKIQTNCMHLLNIGLFSILSSLRAVIVCMLWVLFTSGRQNWADHYYSVGVEG